MLKTFKHRGSSGDILYALPCVIGSGGGKINIVKKQHYELLKSLLKLQPNIDVTHEWQGISLDEYRKDKNIHRKHLAQCHLDALNVSFDLTQAWLFNIDPITVAPIVVNRTNHYHDKNEIDWALLEEYSSQLLFIGFEDEFAVFKKRFVPSAARYRKCKDALEMACLIKGSKLFIGNQSLAFALAEAMKHPRVLEICYKYDNCRPQGANGYIYLTKELIEKCLSM